MELFGKKEGKKEAKILDDETAKKTKAELSHKSKLILFNNEERAKCSHNELLELEYFYDSEDEFGDSDVFERKQAIKDPKSVIAKIDSIKV